MSTRGGMKTGSASEGGAAPNLAKEIKEKVRAKNAKVATNSDMDWFFEGIAEAVIEHLQANLNIKTNVNTSQNNAINTIVIPNSLSPAAMDQATAKVRKNLELGEGNAFEVK